MMVHGEGGDLQQLLAFANFRRKCDGSLLYGTNEPDCLPLFSDLGIESFPEEERWSRACGCKGLQGGTLCYHSHVRRNKEKI